MMQLFQISLTNQNWLNLTKNDAKHQNWSKLIKIEKNDAIVRNISNLSKLIFDQNWCNWSKLIKLIKIDKNDAKYQIWSNWLKIFFIKINIWQKLTHLIKTDQNWQKITQFYAFLRFSLCTLIPSFSISVVMKYTT
jgi:hypothetical protein